MRQKNFLNKFYAGMILAVFVILLVSGLHNTIGGQEEKAESPEKKAKGLQRPGRFPGCNSNIPRRLMSF